MASMIQKIAAFFLPAVLCMGTEVDSSVDPVAQLVQDHTEFAISLYQEIANHSSNAVFSPYSISTCLSMLLMGARGATADEMQTALRLSADREKVANASLALFQQLNPKEGSGYQLKIANAAWVDQQTYVFSDYSHTLERAFQGKIDRVDFQHPSVAVETINRWVSDQTSAQITNLLSSGEITDQTRLVLTNAVYFQGNFVTAFDEKFTKDATFHPTPDTTGTVAMMHQSGSYPYCENDLLQMAGLPFQGSSGKKLSLVILLPKSTENLPQIEQELDNSLVEWLSSMRAERLAIQLPKFKMKKRLDLNTTLQQIGMKIPFTTQANFSGIDGKLDLCLSQVVHEALFSLDEAGVIATAATSASVGLKSALVVEAPLDFIADHPFLFFIVDMRSQEILFMGKFQECEEAHAVPN